MQIRTLTQESLSWAIPRNSQSQVQVHRSMAGLPRGSVLFAALTAQLQQSLGTDIVDGFYGPVTAAKHAAQSGHMAGWDVPRETIDVVDAAFSGRPRKSPITRIVLHETVSGHNDVSRTVDGLKRDGYGVHFVVQWDGTITCLEPNFWSTALRHGGGLNSHSIAIEFMSPYTSVPAAHVNTTTAPDRLGPWSVQIDAQWWTWAPAGGLRYYRCLSRAQMEAASLLVTALIGSKNENMAVPLEFPTAKLFTKVRGWNDPKNPAVPGHGIVAHADYSTHADGRFPLEYIRFRSHTNQRVTLPGAQRPANTASAVKIAEASAVEVIPEGSVES